MSTIKIYSSQSTNKSPISCTCGHCNKNISLNIYAYYYSTLLNKDVYYTGQCPYCGKPIIYDILDESSIPYASIFENIFHLPPDIDTLYNQIKSAFSIGAYTCCVITARTLMANIAIEQGADPGKNFVDYVNYLQESCLPAKTNNTWVDKIRQLGNNSTHKLKIATKEDAELSIKFIVAILKNVYEFPNSIS